MTTSQRPVRSAKRSQLRLFSWAVLVIGAVLGGAAAFGQDWIMRTGIAIAIAAGLIACLLAWREARLVRKAAAVQSAEDQRAAGEALRTQRAQHLTVLGILETRNRDLRQRVTGLTADTASLRQEVNTLRGNNEALRIENRELRRDAEADVLALPRRASGTVDRLSAGELWSEGDVPTVVDLQALSAPFVDEVVRQHA